MTALRPILLSALLFAFAFPAFAERELHVVSVREGWLKHLDFQSRPKATVTVDRPDAEVVLVLLDPGHVDWHIETRNGSYLETMVLGGNDATTSRVFLYDVPFLSPKELGLPFVQDVEGTKFRYLLSRVTEMTGLSGISSFQSIYKAQETPLFVDQVQEGYDVLSVDYLRRELWDLEDAPSDLKLLLQVQDQRASSRVIFDRTGMKVIEGSGERLFPLPAEIDPPFLPAGAYFDRSSERLYGISYGGDGFVYQVDTNTGAWQVLASLQGYNGAELIHHADSGSFAITGAQNKPNDMALLASNGTIENFKFEMDRFAGFKDLYDYPNASPPRLIPTAFDGTWLVLEAWGKSTNPRAGYGLYRQYAVNLETDTVHLLAYRDQ